MRTVLLVVLACGCGLLSGVRVENFPLGYGQHQIIVHGHGNVVPSALFAELHERARQICNHRRYATTNTTSDAEIGEEADPTSREWTVTAIVDCDFAAPQPQPRAVRREPVGPKVCRPLGDEVEALRPPGYVSPSERVCEPARAAPDEKADWLLLE